LSAFRQIVYISTAFPKLSAEQLDELASSASERNAKTGVTGLMVYGDGTFMQVFEGPPDVVGALYKAIRRDPRHRDIITLLDTIRPARDFGAWNMACAEAPDLALNEALIDLRRHQDTVREQFLTLGEFGRPLANMVDRIAAIA